MRVGSRPPVLALLVALGVGCGVRPGGPGPGRPAADTALPAGPADTANPADTATGDPWPDTGVPAGPGLTLVVGGAAAAPGDTLAVDTAPAGVDAASTLVFTLTNRGASDLALSADAAAWLGDDPTWAFVGAPPAAVPAGESVAFTLVTNPVGATAAVTHATAFTVPGVGFGLTLLARTPRPLRVVLTGDDGFVATSDDYGASFAVVSGPGGAADPPRARGLAWGEGVFFRADASGQGWFTEGVYASSALGEGWSPAPVAPDFWPGDCAYGAGRFVCTRGDVLSWSESGGAVVHEATRYGALLNTITFADGQFVAAGRGGRVVRSADGAAFVSDTVLPSGVEWNDSAAGGGVWVLVGGADDYTLATSVDGGLTWAETRWAPSRYARLLRVAWNGDTFLAVGSNNDAPLMYRSADGLNWAPITTTGRWEGYELLGAVEGWFLGVRQDGGVTGVYRSRDGGSWSRVLAEPGVRPRAMAVEGAEGRP